VSKNQGGAGIAALENTLYSHAIGLVSGNHGRELKKDLVQALLEGRRQVGSNDSMGHVDQLPGSLLNHPIPHDATARVNP